MLVTALAPHIGYDQASKIAKNALKNNTSLKYEALKTGLINEKNYEKTIKKTFASSIADQVILKFYLKCPLRSSLAFPSTMP